MITTLGDIAQDNSTFAQSLAAHARPWNDYLRLPVWPIAPNWAEPVLEKLSWFTRVMQSPMGVEQRSSTRLSPRRSLEAEFLRGGADRAFIDNALRAAQGQDWLVPLWMEVTELLAPVEIGATALPIRTTGRSLFVDRPLLIKGPGTYEYEVVQINGPNSPTNCLLYSATQFAWPAGTKVYPLVMARLGEDVQMTKMTAAIGGVSLRWQQMEPDVHPPARLDAAYRGYPVIALRPNDREDVTQVYTYLKDTMPGSVAYDFRYNTARSGLVAHQFRYTLGSAGERVKFRLLLAALRGRLKPAWVPTFNRDLEVVGRQDRASNALRVQRCGYTEFGFTQATRRHVFIQPYGEAPILREIVGTQVEITTEVLMLDSTLPRSYEEHEIEFISFLPLSRLDQDTIELRHETDVDGVCESVLTWVSIIAERQNSAPNIWNF